MRTETSEMRENQGRVFAGKGEGERRTQTGEGKERGGEEEEKGKRRVGRDNDVVAGGWGAAEPGHRRAEGQ